MKNPLVEMLVVTTDGEFAARYSEKGLVELDFPKVGRADLLVSQATRQRRPTKNFDWHKLTAAALKNILAGRDAKKMPPLDWAGKNGISKIRLARAAENSGGQNEKLR